MNEESAQWSIDDPTKQCRKEPGKYCFLPDDSTEQCRKEPEKGGSAAQLMQRCRAKPNDYCWVAADLVQHCSAETAKYRKKITHDLSSCYELFRRALAETSDETKQATSDKVLDDAFDWIKNIYMPLVYSWACGYRGYMFNDEITDFIAPDAFTAACLAMSGERFARFPTIGHILQYIKVCVHNGIAQYYRKHLRLPEVDIEQVQAVAADSRIDDDLLARELWERVCACLPAEQDRLLARRAFVEGFKPREIVGLHPGLWQNERAISVALQRIRRILKGCL